MRIFLTGATGTVGQRVVVDRLRRGDALVVLSRNATKAERLFAADANPRISIVEGDPTKPGAWQDSLDGCDVVIHLAGAPIADRRWTAAYKQVLWDSRIQSTREIVSAMQRAATPPRVLLCASAIGYYGSTGDRATDESGRAGADFLAKLGRAWEDAARAADEFGVRVVNLRLGLVLDDRGGALAKMIPPFHRYVGGPIGMGRQFVSWIHWQDVIGLIDLSLRVDAIRGALNLTAPTPVPNREFSRALGQSLRRPSWLPVPGPALHLVLGEFARYLLMSQRVIPARAQQFGYQFLHRDIDKALQSLLGGADRRAAQPAAQHAHVGLPMRSTTPTQLPAKARATVVAPPRPTHPIRLLAVGVDGTLLRSDGSLPDVVVDACRAATEVGCVIALATARPPRGVRSIMRTLKLQTPVITYNGAVLWNPRDAAPLYHEPLPGDRAERLVRIARELRSDLMVGLEVLDRWYTDGLDDRAGRDGGGLGAPDTIEPLDAHFSQPVTAVNLIGRAGELDEVAGTIRRTTEATGAAAIFRPSPQHVQLVHPLADKAVALQRIARRLDLGSDAVMAIGDGLNDSGMLDWAGFAVAVGNAVPAVQRLADAVVPYNDDMGVAKAIQRFILDPD